MFVFVLLAFLCHTQLLVCLYFIKRVVYYQLLTLVLQLIMFALDATLIYLLFNVVNIFISVVIHTILHG